MNHEHSMWVEDGVDPLLTELREAVRIFHVDSTHQERGQVHAFIRAVFRRAHGAEVDSFYPRFLGFATPPGLRAVVGYRDGKASALFSEQYLGSPVQDLVSARVEQSVARESLVEVGNLALADPGHARWVIACTTAFLAALGHRWVLFTATRPLANAFRRLGLKPVALAPADPARLPDGGASWGRYYAAGPVVYAGDILAGLGKLHSGSCARQPRLQGLLEAARRLGAAHALLTAPANAAAQ